MTTVSVIVPTLRRPDRLVRAIRSLLDQALPVGVVLEIVVVDNAPEGGSEAVLASLCDPGAHHLRVVHEPRLGVATARNAGLAAATGDLVGFLDDDCTAAPDWLATRIACLEATEADAAFGPRLAHLERVPERDADWFVTRFSQDLGFNDGSPVEGLCDYLPLPGSLYRRARCFPEADTFDQRLDQTGGEDILMFKRLAAAGRRLVWCDEAPVIEHVPATRLTHAYVWRRRYADGRVRCLVPSLLKPPHRREIAIQMAKGLAQLALAGPIALAGRVTGAWPNEPTAIAMSGLGKLTWWRGTGPRLYGAGHVG
ncbi:glycosyltransferase family 2 protein [Amorphus sp. 3PC139-8]|uniref:glycosyltransferase family 2 protein n=1 Tax=Amorphus sp. 3PC139-8 TaxID=2735676 RepID=UPI00345C7EC6